MPCHFPLVFLTTGEGVTMEPYHKALCLWNQSFPKGILLSVACFWVIENEGVGSGNRGISGYLGPAVLTAEVASHGCWTWVSEPQCPPGHLVDPTCFCPP